jgi:hypothetical protein
MKLAGLVGALVLALPAPALAWGYEGHRVIALIARSLMSPAAVSRVDALLVADTDPLTAHTLVEAATWADAYRNSHRETQAWHFADVELDNPDLDAACFGFPKPAAPASAGPAQDCVVNRLEAFIAELSNPATPQPERILALKYVLHFMGDLHQPLHLADNHDRGGNCVRISLGGPRTTNLHGYWDRTVVEGMGPDPQAISARLRARITPAQKASWERGDLRGWALESFVVAQRSAYGLGSPPGCGADAAPRALPAGYANAAGTAAAVQLEKAGVRLALVLNRLFGRG